MKNILLAGMANASIRLSKIEEPSRQMEELYMKFNLKKLLSYYSHIWVYSCQYFSVLLYVHTCFSITYMYIIKLY